MTARDAEGSLGKPAPCPPCLGSGWAGGRTAAAARIKCRLCDGEGEVTEERAEEFWACIGANLHRQQPWFCIGEVAGWR